MRTTAVSLLLAVALAVAGCDRCTECQCTCERGGPYRVDDHVGFDCGQTCERAENCGLGNVVASECLETRWVDAQAKTERCARAEAPPR